MADDCSAAKWQRECCVCYNRGLEEEFMTCKDCGAMLYCGTDCQGKDRGTGEATPHGYSHQFWCGRMKLYIARAQELSDLPFTFAGETTDRLFHEHKLAEFLKQYGVYGHGLWRRESPLLHKEQPNKKCGYFSQKEEDKWVLEEESRLLSSPPSGSVPPASDPLMNWQQYYVFRGLHLHSPAAAILSYPLTLYYIITTCLRLDEPDLFERLMMEKTIVIHVLGVEKEVEMKEAFLECAHLLPDIRIHIMMVGKQVSKSVDKFTWETENLHLSIYRALYHKTDLLPPHLAVGFNAGLPAYPTWPATLSKLKTQGTPAYFTDQSEFSCECASTAVQSLGMQGISPVVVNPFRSPLRVVAQEHNMPWFPNAFLFHLVYTHR